MDIQAPQFFDHDGLKLAWYQWGQVNSHPPVVLQHGFAADTHTNWVAPGIVNDLCEAGRWVVGLDARGHGHSEKPHDPQRYGRHQMAADVCALINLLESQFEINQVDFAGYSMGGFVGMHVLTMEPRVRRAIISAVGVTAGAGKNGAGGGTPVVNQLAIADAMERFAADPTMDVKATITDPDALGFLRYARWTGGDLLALAAHMRAPQHSPRGVSRIGAQVLVLAGRDDHLAKTAEDLAALMSTATMVRTSGDHLSAIAQADYRSAFTGFLCADLVS